MRPIFGVPQSDLYSARDSATSGMGQKYGTDGTGNPGGANNMGRITPADLARGTANPVPPVWADQQQFRQLQAMRRAQMLQGYGRPQMAYNMPAAPQFNTAAMGSGQFVGDPALNAQLGRNPVPDPGMGKPMPVAKPMPAVQGQPPFDAAFNRLGRKY